MLIYVVIDVLSVGLCLVIAIRLATLFMKVRKKKVKTPTLLSVLKKIDERIKYRYYLEIDASPQDKSYFEGILDDVESLVRKIIK